MREARQVWKVHLCAGLAMVVLVGACEQKGSLSTSETVPKEGPSAAEPVPVEMKEITYPLLRGPSGGAVVGATAKLGVYPEGTTASKARAQFKKLSEEEKIASPEFLIIHRFDALREGRLDDALEYCHDESRDAAAKRFGDVEAVREFRKKVTDIVFRARIRFGDVLYVKYKMVVPGDWSPTWMATLLRTEEGWRFFVPPGRHRPRHSRSRLSVLASRAGENVLARRGNDRDRGALADGSRAEGGDRIAHLRGIEKARPGGEALQRLLRQGRACIPGRHGR